MKCRYCPIVELCLGGRAKFLCERFDPSSPKYDPERYLHVMHDDRAAKPRVALGKPHCGPCVEEKRAAESPP